MKSGRDVIPVQNLLKPGQNKSPKPEEILNEMMAQSLFVARNTPNTPPSDTTPLTIGIESVNDGVSVIYPRGTRIPVQKSILLEGSSDGHTRTIKVVQGEASHASRNALLAVYEISESRPISSNGRQFKLTFDIDVNGVLHVVAESALTGAPYSINIRLTGAGLSEDEIERLLHESTEESSR